MYTTACVSRKVTYVSLNRGHLTAQTRTYTTLTEQLHQCCWPTPALDCTNKALQNFQVITQLLTEQEWFYTLKLCKQQVRSFLSRPLPPHVCCGKGEGSVGMVTRLPAALEEEDLSPLSATQTGSGPYPVSRSTKVVPRNTTTRAWSWPLSYI
jgi:hypothetical protein